MIWTEIKLFFVVLSTFHQKVVITQFKTTCYKTFRFEVKFSISSRDYKDSLDNIHINRFLRYFAIYYFASIYIYYIFYSSNFIEKFFLLHLSILYFCWLPVASYSTTFYDFYFLYFQECQTAHPNHIEAYLFKFQHSAQ